MNLFSGVRKPFLFAALALTLMLSGDFLSSSGVVRARAVGAASAHLKYSTVTFYYSDASHTQQIGYRYIDCTAHGTLYGTTSPYYTIENIDACCGTSPC